MQTLVSLDSGSYVLSLHSFSVFLSPTPTPAQLQEARHRDHERRKEEVQQAREEASQQAQAYYLHCLHQLVNGEKGGGREAAHLLESNSNVRPEIPPEGGGSPSPVRGHRVTHREPMDPSHTVRHHLKPKPRRTVLSRKGPSSTSPQQSQHLQGAGARVKPLAGQRRKLPSGQNETRSHGDQRVKTRSAEGGGGGRVWTGTGGIRAGGVFDNNS